MEFLINFYSGNYFLEGWNQTIHGFLSCTVFCAYLKLLPSLENFLVPSEFVGGAVSSTAKTKIAPIRINPCFWFMK